MSETNRIKEIRKKSGLTLVRLSQLSDIPRATLSRYENGNSEPKRETYDHLAKILNVSPGYLAGYEDDPVRKLKDETRLTEEYKNQDIYKAFFESGLQHIANSDIFDDDVVEALNYILSSLGLLFSNVSDRRGIVSKNTLVSVATLINRISFLGIGIEYTEDKNLPYIINFLDIPKEEAIKDRTTEIETLNRELENLFKSIDNSVCEALKSNKEPNILNVLAFNSNEE